MNYCLKYELLYKCLDKSLSDAECLNLCVAFNQVELQLAKVIQSNTSVLRSAGPLYEGDSVQIQICFIQLCGHFGGCGL